MNNERDTAAGRHEAPTKLEQIVEIVSDSGEGAQKAGTVFGTVSAKMGNGVWTVEIIPAEIKPPARSRAGASGIRIRFSSERVTNMGDEADLVVAFNEQVLYGRILQNAYRPGTVLLIENMWAEHMDPEVRDQYARALEDFRAREYRIIEVPMEAQCRLHTANPRLGKNMFVVGMLSHIYSRDTARAKSEITAIFRRKKQVVVDMNLKLFNAGYEFARDNIDLHYDVPAKPSDEPLVVMNGNQAVGLGVMAAGMEVVSMYPITPATSASHYLADGIPRVGGIVHQAEDEIAAIAFGIGSSYAGRTACTITSGPGLALKTEMLGLAVMCEVPLVIVLVQRGGPSTGLPTKVEQGDMLACLYGATGDAPKIVMAAATIAECFHLVVTARQLAETFRGPVILLTDANLATGVQPFPRPKVNAEWFAPPIDQSPWDPDVAPYEWDEQTGLSPRPVPGQRGGEYVLTGLAHTKHSKVAYDPHSNEYGCQMRSRKLATLQASLKPPIVNGAEKGGELLVVGWGSTYGAIVEAVERARSEGYDISSVHLRFLSPLEPGLAEIFARFKRVMTVELNYSDPPVAPKIDKSNRRRAQLATLLRSETLVDVDCWSVVHGQPLSPGLIHAQIIKGMQPGRGGF